MKERDRPLIIALRLKVVNGQITEIEHVLARGIRPDAREEPGDAPPRVRHDPGRRPTACPGSRWSTSPTAISKRSSTPNGKLAPFADDCVRRENGGQTTHNAKPVPWPVPLGSKQADDAMAYLGTLSCSDQLDTHVMDFITRLWPRRHEIVDEELGLVFSFPMFQHRGGTGTIKIYNVPGVDSPAAGRLLVQPAGGRDLQDRPRQDHRRSRRWAHRCRTERRARGLTSRSATQQAAPA